MKNIYLSNSLITNFKPKLKNFNKIQYFKKNKTQIFCKNFFLLLLLLKYNEKKNNLFLKSTVFIKPFIKKVFTVLRSPYRHKLTRHQMILNRYCIVSSIKIKSILIDIKNYKQLFIIFKKIESFSSLFESNIISNHRFKFSFIFKYKNNFLFKNFKINKNK